MTFNFLRLRVSEGGGVGERGGEGRGGLDWRDGLDSVSEGEGTHGEGLGTHRDRPPGLTRGVNGREAPRVMQQKNPA